MALTHDHPDSGDDAERGLSRRSLLQKGATGGAGLVLAGNLGLLFGGTAQAAGRGKPGMVGYGPLVPDPAGILSLPKGFTYEIVADGGVTKLATGEPSPEDPDGMAAFVRKGGSGTTLVMNHEISGREAFPVPRHPEFTFNPAAGGGCTTLVVDKDGKRVSQVVSLAGTQNNCAGGRTPWETWLTCEESEATVGGVRHGYVFDVDPHDQAANRNPKPIKALGRFSHESVTVDPATGVVYETEDASNPNGLYFRWTPPAGPPPLQKGALKAMADDAGVLEAMRATSGGVHVPDLSVAIEPGTTYDVEWVVVPDRDATTTSVRKQFTDGEVTRSRKLEGMWWGDGGSYFVSSFARETDSAVAHDGQVWFHDPKAQTIELKIRFAYTPEDQDGDPDGPDNITVSPYGGVILAEDGSGVQHLVGSTESGETFFLARNDDGDSEFCGPTFSQNKKTLFASVQSGKTFAITGPFTKQR